jgi:methyltransferase
MTGIAYAIIFLVVLQRLGELLLANRNTKRLKAQGAVEIGAGHYPLIVLLHTAWLLAVLWLLPVPLEISWPWLAIFVLLQAGRIWVIASLGPYHFRARQGFGQARTLSLRSPSQLPGGRG